MISQGYHPCFWTSYLLVQRAEKLFSVSESYSFEKLHLLFSNFLTTSISASSHSVSAKAEIIVLIICIRIIFLRIGHFICLFWCLGFKNNCPFMFMLTV